MPTDNPEVSSRMEDLGQIPDGPFLFFAGKRFVQPGIHAWVAGHMVLVCPLSKLESLIAEDH